jgi:signal transduction histidine kinase
MTYTLLEGEHAANHPAIAALHTAIRDGLPVGTVRTYKYGDLLIREGDLNDALLVILEGRVLLLKGYARADEVAIGTLEAGDLVGVLSFYGRGQVFSTARAKTDVVALQIKRREFEALPKEQPGLAEQLQSLVITNLADRYRRILNLHIEVAALTREVEIERNQLQHALDELQSTRNRLIHQEKMAILGQLVAGIAHELNNPVSALLRGAETISTLLPDALGVENKMPYRMLVLGQERSTPDTAAQQDRMNILEQRYPSIRRSLIRTLSQIPPAHFDELARALRLDEPDAEQRLGELIPWFEIGMFLRNIEIASTRIGNLVSSLKGYSRQSKDDVERVDVRRGIEETLLLLGNRLKNVTVHLQLDEVPLVQVRPGEINQVWTNVILNACDAMHDRGELTVRTEAGEGGTVIIAFADSGPGIPPEVLPKIFEAHFTTKTASGSFGLGLGLAISNEIVRKHGGTIVYANVLPPGTGALCTVTLPGTESEGR